ncbi:MAG: AMP-binding protein [Burkholderiales bacterium]
MQQPQALFASLYEAFLASVADAADLPFLCVPAGREIAPDGQEWTFGETARRVEAARRVYAAAGFGRGHRVALLLGNRPDHFVHLLALNGLGVSQVPVNPDYRPDELLYLLDHSQADLLVCLPEHLEVAVDAARRARKAPPVIAFSGWGGALPAPQAPAAAQPIDLSTEASLMYTSGTTGRPKACVLSNRHFLNFAQWYIDMGREPRSVVQLRQRSERLYNPLTVYHVSAGVLCPVSMILLRGCLIMPGRFSASRWWPEVVQTRATLLHYIGLVPAALMKLPPDPLERAHQVRWGLGAGIEPSIHRAFEERFGFPNIEVWGMTEIAGFLADDIEPRVVGQRAFGRESGDLQARIVDEAGNDLPDGTPGRLLVRTTGPDPRYRFFDGYLGDAEATEAAWQGGWFHTGDVARRDPDGSMYFVDRTKNIIRRSGENIAAGEIEAVLLASPEVAYAAAIAVPDAVRQEEVYACIVVQPGVVADAALARRLFDLCRDKLAYYKAPGWLHFLDSLPLTATQKVQKASIFAKGVDPTALAGVHDFRTLKRQQP